MGLTDRLHRLAARRPHVLLLPVPGAIHLRVAAERELRERGWVLAGSPADADVLLVVGVPGPALGRAADRVFEQLPGPRVRLDVALRERLATLLDSLPPRLADRATHVSDAVERGDGPHGGAAEPDDSHEHAANDDMDMGGMDHADMDMGGMDMSMLGDLAMADREADRDGLKLDVLHEPFGPVLPHWPAGLVLDTVLQGDVVVRATARVLPGAGPVVDPFVDDPEARRLDRLATLLAVAGWGELAVRVQRERDESLTGRHSPSRDRLLARVARSRALGLIGRDLPTGDGHDVSDHVARLCGGDAAAPLTDLDALADAVTGLDMGSVRLVVAALAPDTDRVAPRADTPAGAP